MDALIKPRTFTTHKDLAKVSPTVVVRDITKTYIVRGAESSSTSRKVFRRRAMPVHALKGVSFVATEGESIGILGSNGSGKSTLLRLIAGGESPTSGDLRVMAEPILLGISAALQPELSGRRNVELGCLAMGMTPAETRKLYEPIVELSGIGDAIYRPMKTYSSGMAARLRFAIATAVDPEILLIDEALSAGDAAFEERATQRMNELLSKAGTMFLVSHSAQTIQKMCSRAIWLHEGRIIADGEAEDVAVQYRVWAWRMAKDREDEAKVILDGVISRYRKPLITLNTDQDTDVRERHRHNVR